ncbi:MAG TPA: HepT-like ribonuclease domain-containing protein [Beijerinckiaceae bacterium]|nr:HepT-like ribonuclease domain-containing protein [Beijerinckiaceae bacterium]
MASTHLPRLRDILQVIDEIAEIIAGLDLAAYQADVRSRRAVERCIEIVSEASRHIPDDEKVRFPDVPWSDIAGIGNIFRHEYYRVADPVVWRTASRSIPELRPVIEAMIKRAERLS